MRVVAFSTISKITGPHCLSGATKPLYHQIMNMEEMVRQFITESFPGQFKNWFYSLIAMSAVLENQHPFESVLGFATLLAEDGKPMHKSSGNMIEFSEGADKIGVDVMRWIYCRQNPSDNLLFGYKIADEVRRSFHLKIWNVVNFFIGYANMNYWNPELDNSTKSENIIDT
jgi:isoleucyl-tRNA synthetase